MGCAVCPGQERWCVGKKGEERKLEVSHRRRNAGLRELVGWVYWSERGYWKLAFPTWGSSSWQGTGAGRREGKEHHGFVAELVEVARWLIYTDVDTTRLTIRRWKGMTVFQVLRQVPECSGREGEGQEWSAVQNGSDSLRGRGHAVCWGTRGGWIWRSAGPGYPRASRGALQLVERGLCSGLRTKAGLWVFACGFSSSCSLLICLTPACPSRMRPEITSF